MQLQRAQPRADGHCGRVPGRDTAGDSHRKDVAGDGRCQLPRRRDVNSPRAGRQHEAYGVGTGGHRSLDVANCANSAYLDEHAYNFSRVCRSRTRERYLP